MESYPSMRPKGLNQTGPLTSLSRSKLKPNRLVSDGHYYAIDWHVIISGVLLFHPLLIKMNKGFFPHRTVSISFNRREAITEEAHNIGPASPRLEALISATPSHTLSSLARYFGS
ncbi:hypothetical protein L3X38_009215 [Prunus dulcis]|uniref:Uncharacterized protein n=1 Tax=Prunus dulcis TaxID=3755 RepID=A0AAD4ZXX8_PRUDU|nr:hypothetical protein L3X38_009215 [Prunus dulcis]